MSLNLPTAQDLLNGRVIGLPEGFIKLCFVLSGGLPKDLLRIARTVAAIKSDKSSDTPELALAAAAAITDELEGLVHRAMADAASLEILAAPDLLKLLSDSLWQIIQSKSPAAPPRRSTSGRSWTP